MSLSKKGSELPQELSPSLTHEMYIWKNGVSQKATLADLPLLTETEANRQACEDAAAATAADRTAVENSETAVEADRAEVAANAAQVATDTATATQAASDAQAAAQAGGVDHVEADYATANAAVGGYANGDKVLVLSDENNGNAATYYEVVGGALSFIGLVNALNTAAYPALSQNKPQSYWLEKLLAETALSVQPTPSLVLDFENDVYKVEGESKTFAEAITYTRSTTATKRHASGKIGTAAVDEPQFVYDAETGKRSLLLEPRRTNLIAWSQEIDNPAWLKVGATINANQSAAPDGSVTADYFIPSALTEVHYITQNILTQMSRCTASVFVRIDSPIDKVTLYPGGTRTFANFNLATKTISFEANVESAYIEDWGNGYFRLIASWSADVNVSTFRIYSSSGNIGASNQAGNGTDGIYIWGAQLEQGSYPTSYIPTAGAAVTRGSEIAKLPVGEWFNTSEGTLVAELEVRAELNGISQILSGDGNSRFLYSFPDNARAFNGISSYTLKTGIAHPYRAKFAFSVSGDGGRGAINGESRDAPANYDFSPFLSIAELKLAAVIHNPVTFTHIRYYPTALTEAELIALTTPTEA